MNAVGMRFQAPVAKEVKAAKETKISKEPEEVKETKNAFVSKPQMETTKKVAPELHFGTPKVADKAVGHKLNAYA